MLTPFRITAVMAMVALGAGGLLLSTVGSPSTSSPSSAGPSTASPSPSAMTSEAEELLGRSIAARIAGEGADEYGLYPYEVPLLYETSTGDRYERGEFEPVLDKEWPYGSSAYRARLFAGGTVVEQLFFWTEEGPPVISYSENGFATEIPPTTEDGQPVALEYDYFNGALALKAAHPWVMSDYGVVPFGRLIPEGSGVPPTTDGGQRRDWDRIFLMADPAWVGTGCQTGPQPGDAEAHAAALAESIQSDPGLEATTPVAVSVGGYEGLMMDVNVAAGASLCWNVSDTGDPTDDPGVLYFLEGGDAAMMTGDGHATGYASGDWMRLYLFDVPATSGMQWLAVAIVAPEAHFERAVTSAVPLIDSIEVHS